MKKISILVLTIILISTLTACSSKSPNEIASNTLGFDLSSGKVISSYDTHSGNGDGSSCFTFSFDDNAILDHIQKSSDWNPFPIDETTQAIIYGISDKDKSVGPFLNDNHGKALVPEIQNGYYILIDRQSKEIQQAEPDLLKRPSFNLTLCLYDTDTNMLYYCELDT